MLYKYILISLGLILLISGGNDVFAQYPPPAGQAGSTAIHKDSSAFVDWASGCYVERGFMNIANQGAGFVNSGEDILGTGKSGENGVVSLGDGGVAVLTFNSPIVNGNSWDFAVFENSFSDNFLELAFVEVSSDGLNFYRFDAVSLTDTNVQVGSFGTLDATKISNLAGKYRLFYGTPFDLEELKDEPGLDINNISHIRIIDVIGCISAQYTTYDSYGTKINDPWPTEFASGGFDLDAVGVIWNKQNSISETDNKRLLYNIYPNPATSSTTITFKQKPENSAYITISEITGKIIFEIYSNNKSIDIDLNNIEPGIYFIRINNGMSENSAKLIIQ